jgi:hypothetical protein
MKILIAGAGGAPSEGVINSLIRCEKKEEIIGMGSEPTDLVLSSATRKYFVPYANDNLYKNSLIKILEQEKPDLIHFQNDLEIFYASQLREDIHILGTKTFMPKHDVIDTCVYKYKTFLKFKSAGLKVPETVIINNQDDLKHALKILGNKNGKVWLRATSIGGGGKGSAPVGDFNFGRAWIEHYSGWGEFSASELLTPDTVTWLSIWYEGELIVAQSRIRKGWTHGNRTISGVTGVTKVGQTYSNDQVNDISLAAIKSVDEKPHGIYGVDMAYDFDGIPNPTEINISRFFTTILFFTEAGLNMPKIFKDIALYDEFPILSKKINPLENGLLWLRGMDTKPRLMKNATIENEIIKLI